MKRLLFIATSVVSLYCAYEAGRASGYRQAIVVQSMFLQAYAHHPDMWPSLQKWYQEGHVGICDSMMSDAEFAWWLDYHCTPTKFFNARIPANIDQIPYRR